MLSVSAIAAAGGLVMYAFVPDGPHLKPGASFDPTAFADIFRSPDFRASSFAYFGHMWELYALWAFIPQYLAAFGPGIATDTLGISFWSSIAIGSGAIGCIMGGLASLQTGKHESRVRATGSLRHLSCCSLLAFWMPYPVFLAFLVFWGVVVVGNSPQFSALNARYAPTRLVGSALTIVNCIGFAITIVSIQLLNNAVSTIGARYLFLFLVPGPIVGLLALRHLLKKGGRVAS